MKVKSEVAQSCPTLSDPMDCSLPGSSVHGVFQARVLEWGAIAFSGSGVLENSKMVLAGASVFAVGQTHSNGCGHHLHLKGKSKWPPASLGAPGSFQITASVLGLKSYKILCAPFKSGVSAFYSPMALPYNSRVVRMCYN